VTAIDWDALRRGRAIEWTDQGEPFFIDHMGARVIAPEWVATELAADRADGGEPSPRDQHLTGDVVDVPSATRGGSARWEPTGWPTLRPEARHGLAATVLDVIGPHSEADPAALLVSFLVACGSAMHQGPHVIADGARHPARLFAVIVGKTSRARKGTSWRNVHNVMSVADVDWAAARVLSGLSSGEGLIAAVGDGIPNKDGDLIGAVHDKRLLVVEEEFARVLMVKSREANTLSPLLRDAWDNGDLRSMTKRPLIATGAHVSILGHITVGELRRTLTATDIANGFGNRFLWVAARRAALLPNGGSLDDDDLARLGRQVGEHLAVACSLGRMRRSGEAEERWDFIYREMAAEDEDEGLADALLARAESHVLRLSLIYAALDGSGTIELPHLLAAEAVWAYCAASVRYMFGEATGDPIAERILGAVTAAGAAGLSREAQSELFRRHQPAKRLEAARSALLHRRVVVEEEETTEGRPRLVLRLAKYANKGCVTSLPSPTSRSIAATTDGRTVT
jgi:hypothetical protein